MDPTRVLRLEQFREEILGGPIHSEDTARVVLELALLMAGADGDVSEREAEQIVDVVHRLSNSPFDLAALRFAQSTNRELLATDGIEKRIESAGERLQDPAGRRQAYRIVAAVALVDGWLDRNELRFFHQLARVFAISPEESQKTVTDIRRRLFPEDER